MPSDHEDIRVHQRQPGVQHCKAQPRTCPKPVRVKPQIAGIGRIDDLVGGILRLPGQVGAEIAGQPCTTLAALAGVKTSSPRVVVLTIWRSSQVTGMWGILLFLPAIAPINVNRNKMLVVRTCAVPCAAQVRMIHRQADKTA